MTFATRATRRPCCETARRSGYLGLRQNCPHAHPVQRFDYCPSSSFCFLFFYVVAPAGRKARPGSRRIPQRQTSGAARIKQCTSTRVHSVRTHSAFNRGLTAPLHRSSPCRYCASAIWFCRLPVPSEHNRRLRPRLPSGSGLPIPKPIPSANRLRASRPVLQTR